MLRCSECGRLYEDRWRCECGGPLEFDAQPVPDGPPPDSVGVSDWHEVAERFLPVDTDVTLGEGFTPLVDAPNWGCEFILEYVSPTGSFKDRGAAVTLARADELGVNRVLEDSSGNAGVAIATYAAAAGIDANIFVPKAVADAKLRAISRTGAEVTLVEGSRDTVASACIQAVQAGEGWYASHAWNPAFLAGTAQFAYEVAARHDWTVPDAVVTPLGHGTLYLGAFRGFQTLVEAGWTDQMPRLLGAQAAGVAPIVEELSGPAAAAGNNDLAKGVQIRSPVRQAQILEAVERTDGDVVAVDRQSTERTLEQLHRRGFAVEATAAIAPAALQVYRDRDILTPNADVVVPLTGRTG